MINKFKGDIEELSENVTDFWSMQSEIILSELDKMKYDREYGKYLCFHNVNFLSVLSTNTPCVSLTVRKTYYTSSLYSLHRLLFSEELIRMYTIHLIEHE